MKEEAREYWDWKTYRKMLVVYGYEKEQISQVRKIREKCELCEFEQFSLLFQQKLVERKVKLRKPRHLYVNEEGEFLYLNHHNKRFEIVGHFKAEE